VFETRSRDSGQAKDRVGCVGSGEAHTLAVSSYSHEVPSWTYISPELTKPSIPSEIHTNGLFVALDLRALVLQHARARCGVGEVESQVRSPVPPEPDIPAP